MLLERENGHSSAACAQPAQVWKASKNAPAQVGMREDLQHLAPGVPETHEGKIVSVHESELRGKDTA